MRQRKRSPVRLLALFGHRHFRQSSLCGTKPAKRAGLNSIVASDIPSLDSRLASARAFNKGDRGAFGHPARDAFGVPIRQTDAPVRLGLGHLPRKWCAVDAVSLG